MSAQDTQHTVHAYLDALVNGGDFASFFAEDVSWTTMETGDQIHGREAVRDFIIALHSLYFDASPELGNVTVGDGVAALEAVFVGTHIAEFAGVSPTGAVVRAPYSVSYDILGGKIEKLRAYFPILALVQQLKEAAAALG